MIAAVRRNVVGVIAIIVALVVFIVPFSFIVLTAMKPQQEASLLQFSWPEQFAFFENLIEVISARDFMLLWAFVNSTILTVAAVTLMVVFSAMVGWVLQRRPSKLNPFINFLVLSGLIIRLLGLPGRQLAGAFVTVLILTVSNRPDTNYQLRQLGKIVLGVVVGTVGGLLLMGCGVAALKR